LIFNCLKSRKKENCGLLIFNCLKGRKTEKFEDTKETRRETDNTMVNKGAKTKRDRQYNGHQRDGQAMIHKTLPVKVKIEQHHAH
jgi:hypothetical protein